MTVAMIKVSLSHLIRMLSHRPDGFKSVGLPRMFCILYRDSEENRRFATPFYLVDEGIAPAGFPVKYPASVLRFPSEISPFRNIFSVRRFISSVFWKCACSV